MKGEGILRAKRENIFDVKSNNLGPGYYNNTVFNEGIGGGGNNIGNSGFMSNEIRFQWWPSNGGKGNNKIPGPGHYDILESERQWGKGYGGGINNKSVNYGDGKRNNVGGTEEMESTPGTHI